MHTKLFNKPAGFVFELPLIVYENIRDA